MDTYLRDGVPAGALDDIPESELNGGFGTRGTRFATSTIQFWDQHRVLPYSQNFNLTLQSRWKGVIWDFGFIGGSGPAPSDQQSQYQSHAPGRPGCRQRAGRQHRELPSVGCVGWFRKTKSS